MIESALSDALVALALPPAIAAGRLAGYDVTLWGRLLGAAHARLHAPPAPDGSVLCHLDLQPFNVLAVGDRVTGIVDWANARVGDRREDLAWSRVVLAFGAASAVTGSVRIMAVRALASTVD
ncbi:MAG TPA: phosphotransferase [Jatrophihabitantaceae bacterium]|nr:phosphotransferase [Jatrophihabitantaceae bacterium]